jgi:hypothetical protein
MTSNNSERLLNGGAANCAARDSFCRPAFYIA